MEICIKFWPFNPLTRSTLNVQWNRKLVVRGSSARNQIQFSFSPSQHQKTIHILFSPMTRNNSFKRTELCNSWKWSFLLSFDSYLVTNSYVRIKFKDQLQPMLMKKNHCSMTQWVIEQSLTHLWKNGRQFKPMIHKREGGGGMYRNIKNNIPAENFNWIKSAEKYQYHFAKQCNIQRRS